MKLTVVLIVFVIFALIIAGCSENKPESQKSQATHRTVDMDTVSEASLFEHAAKAEASNRYKDAIVCYNAIIEKYPDSPRRDKAIFMSGYIQYEYLKSDKLALESFNKVLREYPNSDLIDDAEFMIKAINSGKDALTTFEETSSGK